MKMKKVVVLISIIYFFTVFGCSKESPVSSDNLNVNTQTDWPINAHYHVHQTIIQHTGWGDTTLVDQDLFTSDMGWSRSYSFTTLNTTSTFTRSRFVEWRNAEYSRSAIWTLTNNTRYSYNMFPGSGTYSSDNDISLGLGNTYSSQIGIDILTK